ncbi:MAG: pyrroline-5-carboxylate reductase [Candidatus Omnitrophota bacterium]
MKKNMNNIGIIGAGNMGEAIIRGIKSAADKGLINAEVLVFEKDKKKILLVSKKFGARKCSGLEELINNSKAVIICVKPQDIEVLLEEISTFDLKGKIFISIAAGVTTGYILKKLKAKVSVVRVMPNINALVGESVNALCKGKYASDKDISFVKRIFSGTGENFVVSEKQMDVITAVSGSGPAYAALFMKALFSAAEKNGLSREHVKEMVFQTLTGTLKMLKEQKLTPEVFIEKVKSKGGTTEAAFKVFDGAGFEAIILEAVSAAKKRSIELGRK